MSNDQVFDAWSPISYKFGSTGVPAGMPTWLGDHRRRLAAYNVLQTYVDNTARVWLQPPDSNDIVAGRDPEDQREYGDPSLIVKTILAGILGNEQKIVCEGAELKGQPQDEVSEERISVAEVDRAFEVQTYLETWRKAARFDIKLIESERNAVSLGDAIYIIQFDGLKNKINIESLNPGFYFPVLSDDPTSQYPDKVHLAWELPREIDAPNLVKIRRITYELVDDPVEFPTHTYAYAPGVQTRTRCLLSDGTWTIDATHQVVDDLTEAKVKWNKNSEGVVVRNLDIGVDFIPVIHIPNTVAEENHYGRSSLSEVLQILDDIASTDTDLQAASATTGTPPLAIGGTSPSGEITTYGPGTVFQTGDGKMDVLDTSKALDALLKYVRGLLERLAINARVAEAAIGRVNAAQVPSGIALALSFAPMEQMVREMRQMRDDKYPLLFKFVLRFAIEARLLPAGELPDVTLLFGSFLPTDRKTIVDEVVALFTAGAVSTRTAVMMLHAAGLPIDDAALEVKRIEEHQSKKIAELALAMGPKAALEFLGLNVPAGVTNDLPTNGGTVGTNTPPAPNGGVSGTN